MPSYSVRRSRIKEFKEIAGPDINDTTAEKILSNNDWKIQESLNDFFNNRHKYPTSKKGNPDKLKKIFKKYADKEDETIMSENGMMQFFKDTGVNPQGVDTLVIAWHIRSTEMGLIQRDDFCQGFAKHGCSDLSSVKNECRKAVSLTNNSTSFKMFYKWVFHHVKEDEKKKTIPKDLAVQLWRIIFGKREREFPMLSKFLNFVEKNEDTQAVSRDLWEQTLDFLKEVKSPNDFDDNGAWPVTIDEFMDSLNS